MKSSATTSAFGWVSNFRFSIFKRENSVWAELNTAWFSSFSAAIAFIRKNYGKPKATHIIQDYQPSDFSTP
jgi:hypothetical protein